MYAPSTEQPAVDGGGGRAGRARKSVYQSLGKAAFAIDDSDGEAAADSDGDNTTKKKRKVRRIFNVTQVLLSLMHVASRYGGMLPVLLTASIG